MKKDKSRSALGLVFGIVFLDIVGFSILFPLYPDLLDHYVSQEGADSLAGRLAADPTASLVVGDEVAWSEHGGAARIERILPRRSSLGRTIRRS